MWYRGPSKPSGSVVRLEDWFDPNRLKDNYVPTGFKGYDVKTPQKRRHFLVGLQTISWGMESKKEAGTGRLFLRHANNLPAR